MIMIPLASILNVLTLIAFVHPIHVSVTEIEYDQKQKALEIMMRVFIDDMELTLRNSLNRPDLDILKPTGSTTDDLIRDYVPRHFRLSLDNQDQKINYLGHEREGEAFIFYIEVSNVKPWKTITVHNDIIMGTYEDQSNIVHVYVGEDVKSLRLTRNTPADNLTFDNK